MMEKPENDCNPGKWVLIWEYSARAIQWIPKWQINWNGRIIDNEGVAMMKFRKLQNSAISQFFHKNETVNKESKCYLQRWNMRNIIENLQSTARKLHPMTK